MSNIFATPLSLPGYFHPGHSAIVHVDQVSGVILEHSPLLPLAAGSGSGATGREAVGRGRDG